MKKNSLFVELESQEEIKNYIKNLKSTRNINGISIHHMALPDFDCWEQDLKRWGDDACLNRTNSLDSYGKTTWNYSDGEGRYIAQHFNIFPNGHVSTGRSINSTPIGVKNWNTGKIVIEAYGNFDNGKDVMETAQAQAVIVLLGELASRFNVTVSDVAMRPHCWFTAGGTYLGDYSSSKSSKTCPGTNFMEIGNTYSAFTGYFYNWIKDYQNTGKFPTKFGGEVEDPNKIPVPPKPATPTVMPGKYIVRYLQTCLNESYGCKLALDGSFGPATQRATSKYPLKSGCKGEHVTWLQKALVNRGYDLVIDGSFGPATLAALKKYQKSRNLTVDGFAGLNTHKSIIND